MGCNQDAGMATFLIAPKDDPLASAIESALRESGRSLVRLTTPDEYKSSVRDQGTQLVVALASADKFGTAAAVAFAEAHARDTYLIYVADDISAADFRRLLDTRAAEWIPAADAARDIVKTIENSPVGKAAAAATRGANFVSFVPAGGGVGNTTLAVECALHYAMQHKSSEPTCCVVDLNFQQGNACDLLDLEPKLDMAAIAQDPGRLDYKLLEAFRSRSEFGIDVYAQPKFPPNPGPINPEAVFALCNVLSERYDRVHADFPSYLFPWMFDIIQASDKLVVSTICSVPAALRVQTLLGEMRGVDPAKVCIVVNRFQSGMFKKSLSAQNFESSIGSETFIYISDDHGTAMESANVGRPIMVVAPKVRLAKDIQQVERFIDPPNATAGLFSRALSKFKSRA
jgi:pilus assembly protein CpaE